MNESAVISMVSKSLVLMIILILPVVLPVLITGLAVSIFQALTQIQEHSLAFLPKLIVVFVALAIAGNWMMDKILNFTREIFLLIMLR